MLSLGKRGSPMTLFFRSLVALVLFCGTAYALPAGDPTGLPIIEPPIVDCVADADCGRSTACLSYVCKAGTCVKVGAATGTVCPDDGVVCTDDKCDGSGLCVHPNKAAGGTCDDAKPCTYADACDGNGVCAGRPLTCSDGTCVTRSCDGTDKCKEVPKMPGTLCDDMLACTYADACDSAGVCTGKAISCTDSECVKRSCQNLDKCREEPKPSGTTCTDGAICTHSDACDGMGTCAGKAITCTHDTCNNRACNGGPNCTVTPKTGTMCDDANVCTYGDACSPQGVCAGTALSCVSDATTVKSCNGTATCLSMPRVGAACDDNDPCTKDDSRKANGTCGGTAFTCPVSGCLMANECDGAGGCRPKAKPDGTACDADGSKCTPNDLCRAGSCVKDTKTVTCVEKDCNAVSCNPTTGNCDYKPSTGGACGATGCFASGMCNEGMCSGKPKDCSALAGPCTAGACDAKTGSCVVINKPNGTACGGGGKCAMGATCMQGVCELPKTTCPVPSNPCRVASCDPATGQCAESRRPVGTACSTKDACEADPVCDSSGMCAGARAAIGTPCTDSLGLLGKCATASCTADPNVSLPGMPRRGAETPVEPDPTLTPGGSRGVGGPAASAEGAGEKPKDSGGSNGCAMAPGQRGARPAGLALALFTLGLVWARRRRRD